MASNGWGGKRPGAGSGGKRPGAGRPRKVWNSGGRGTHWVMERETIGGSVHRPQMWVILSISDDEIEFQCDNDIIVLRKPDDYE